MYQVVKRDGKIAEFNIAKISAAITKAFQALEKAYREDQARAARLAMVLYAQAELIAGLPLDDPAAYTELVCSLF